MEGGGRKWDGGEGGLVTQHYWQSTNELISGEATWNTPIKLTWLIGPDWLSSIWKDTVDVYIGSIFVFTDATLIIQEIWSVTTGLDLIECMTDATKAGDHINARVGR